MLCARKILAADRRRTIVEISAARAAHALAFDESPDTGSTARSDKRVLASPDQTQRAGQCVHLESLIPNLRRVDTQKARHLIDRQDKLSLFIPTF